MLSIKLRESLLKCIESVDKRERLDMFYELRHLLMDNLEELTEEEVDLILGLFIYGLENSKLKTELRNSGHYLAGNTSKPKWKALFQTGNYSLEDIRDFTESVILSNPNARNLDFDLRNAEVTLRDDVIFDNFDRYKDICKSVLNDILNGKGR